MLRNKGFTLIELMIVIAIIAILLAIIAPIFKSEPTKFDTVGDNNIVQVSEVAPATPAAQDQTTPATGKISCFDGLMFDATGRQVIDEYGNGVRCNVE